LVSICWFDFLGDFRNTNCGAQTSEAQFTVISDVQDCKGGGRPLLMERAATGRAGTPVLHRFV
jgi:hypothetical protein